MINPQKKNQYTHNTIYMIRNKALNKCYIGRSIQPDRRLSDHFTFLRHGKGFIEMQKDFDEYGEDSFEVEILETLPLKECDPVEREDYYILKYNAIKGGYNSKMASPYGSVQITAVVDKYVRNRVKELARADKVSASQWIGDIVRKEIERADKNESKG